MTSLSLGHFSFSWARTKEKISEVADLFDDKEVLGLSASVAYYTVLSLTPFLLLFFAFLGFIGWNDLPRVKSEITYVLGPSAAVVLQSLQDRLQTDEGGLAFGIFGLFTLIFSATGAISQLQVALNSILSPEQNRTDARAEVNEQKHSAIGAWVRTKLFSILVLLFCVFISTVSLILSIAIRVFLSVEGQQIWIAINTASSVLVFSLVFLLMFRYLPTHRRESWSFCLKAGLLCSFLFHLGKWAMESYFSHSGIATSYGALSSFVIFLLWAYYNGIIILASACFSRVFFDEKV